MIRLPIYLDGLFYNIYVVSKLLTLSFQRPITLTAFHAFGTFALQIHGTIERRGPLEHCVTRHYGTI